MGGSDFQYAAASRLLWCTRWTPSRAGPKHAPAEHGPGRAGVAQKWAHLGPSRPRAKHHQDVTVHVGVPRRDHARPSLVPCLAPTDPSTFQSGAVPATWRHPKKNVFAAIPYDM